MNQTIIHWIRLKGNYNHVKQYVTNVYGYVTHDFLNTDGAMQDAATDDAIHVYEGSNIQRFVNGTWSPTYTDRRSIRLLL